MENLTMTAGQPGRFKFALSGDYGELRPVGYVAVTAYPGAKPVPTEMKWNEAEGALLLPPLPFGCFFYEVRLGTLEVAKGHIDCVPTPFPYDPEEYKTWTVTDEDVVADVVKFAVTAERGPQGPQGEPGPQGEKGEKGDKGDKGDPGLTQQQIDLLTLYASAEGRTIPIVNGVAAVQVGHTYVVSASGDVSGGCGDVEISVSAGKQVGFVAVAETVQLNGECVLTEVFKPAAPIELSGSMGGGDDLKKCIQAEFLQGLGSVGFKVNVYDSSKVQKLYIDLEPYRNPWGLDDWIVWFGYTDDSTLQYFRISTAGRQYVSEDRHDKLIIQSDCGTQDSDGIDRYFALTPWGQRITVEYDSEKLHYNGEYIMDIPRRGSASQSFDYIYLDYRGDTKIYAAKHWYDGKLSIDIEQLLTPEGRVILKNKVTGQMFYGSWWVGLSIENARKLSDLSNIGGGLNLSLPVGYESDAGVANALETARGKGWSIAVRTYTQSAVSRRVATFGMRRIWVKKIQDKYGVYVDTAGTRWQVEWCEAMYTPDGSTPDMHGYEMFRSVDAAVAYWELEPWVDPEEEL